MRGPGMTSRGMRWAFLFGLLLFAGLPKNVPCGYPGAGECQHLGKWRAMCTPYELEPYVFYLIELVANRDVGFAYSIGEECR